MGARKLQCTVLEVVYRVGLRKVTQIDFDKAITRVAMCFSMSKQISNEILPQRSNLYHLNLYHLNLYHLWSKTEGEALLLLCSKCFQHWVMLRNSWLLFLTTRLTIFH